MSSRVLRDYLVVYFRHRSQCSRDRFLHTSSIINKDFSYQGPLKALASYPQRLVPRIDDLTTSMNPPHKNYNNQGGNGDIPSRQMAPPAGSGAGVDRKGRNVAEGGPNGQTRRNDPPHLASSAPAVAGQYQSQPRQPPHSERKNAKRNAEHRKKPNTQSTPKTALNAGKQLPQRMRPTHFLALPLHNHSNLRERISAFQNALFAPPTKISQPTIGSAPIPEEGTKANATASKGKESANPKSKSRKKPTVSSIIEGLDTSIVIDPRRMHMTLGVMALELDDVEPQKAEGESGQQTCILPCPIIFRLSDGLGYSASKMDDPPQTSLQVTGPSSPPPAPKKTVTTALSLLTSIKPQISEILKGSKGVDVPLETLHVLKTTRISASREHRDSSTKGSGKQVDVTEDRTDLSVVKKNEEDASVNTDPRPVLTKTEELEAVNSNFALASTQVPESSSRDKVGAGVLYIAPRTRKLEKEDEIPKEEDVEYRKLVQVCDLIYRTFKDAGYITDARPLTLHCTILNASHRKPPRRIPFSYTDILESEAIKVLTGGKPTPTATCAAFSSQSESTSENLLEEEEDKFFPSPNAEKSPTEEVEQLNLTETLPNPIVLVDAPLQNIKPKPKPKFRPPITIPPPLPIDLGAVRVHEVQLWEMGSHGPNNEYVNCGGIILE